MHIINDCGTTCHISWCQTGHGPWTTITMYWSFRPKLNFLTWSYLLDDWFFCIWFDKNNTFGIWCHKIDMYSITESNILYHNMCKKVPVKTQLSLCRSLLLLMIPNLIGLPIILTILSKNMHMHLLFLLSTAVERSDTLNSKWIFDNYVYDKSKMFCIIEYS